MQEAANGHGKKMAVGPFGQMPGLNNLAEALSLPGAPLPDPRDRHGYYTGLLDDGTPSDYWPVLEYSPEALNPRNCPALDLAEWPFLPSANPSSVEPALGKQPQSSSSAHEAVQTPPGACNGLSGAECKTQMSVQSTEGPVAGTENVSNQSTAESPDIPHSEARSSQHATALNLSGVIQKLPVNHDAAEGIAAQEQFANAALDAVSEHAASPPAASSVGATVLDSSTPKADPVLKEPAVCQDQAYQDAASSEGWQPIPSFIQDRSYGLQPAASASASAAMPGLKEDSLPAASEASYRDAPKIASKKKWKKVRASNEQHVMGNHQSPPLFGAVCCPAHDCVSFVCSLALVHRRGLNVAVKVRPSLLIEQTHRSTFAKRLVHAGCQKSPGLHKWDPFCFSGLPGRLKSDPTRKHVKNAWLFSLSLNAVHPGSAARDSMRDRSVVADQLLCSFAFVNQRTDRMMHS